MKVAVVCSRGLLVEDIGKYLPDGTCEIITGGARDIGSCAREYAAQRGLKLTEFFRSMRSMVGKLRW